MEENSISSDEIMSCWNFVKKILKKIIGYHHNKSVGEWEKWNYTIRITTKCSYNAVKREKTKQYLSTVVSIIVPLILILIPLLQLANVKFNFTNDIMVSMQCFFAMIMLVYSIIIATSGQEIKIEKLIEKASKLKELTRRMPPKEQNDNNDDSLKFPSQNNNQPSSVSLPQDNLLRNIIEEYNAILKIDVTHKDIDHLKAKMDMHEFSITGLTWLMYKVSLFFGFIKENLASITILLLTFDVLIESTYKVFFWKILTGE